MKLERKSDKIKVLEADSSFSNPAIYTRGTDLKCQNCKERYYLIEAKGDHNNVFCTNCGSLTPTRTMKHNRGLAVPAIQQTYHNASIVQSSKKDQGLKGKDRKPRGINPINKKNEIEQALIAKGFTVIDSQVVEPSS